MNTPDDIGRELSHPQLVAIPAFTDNVIWAFCGADGGSCIVVDPGDAAPVQRWLAQGGRRLVAILVTHHHADHCGGIAGLRDEQVVVYGPRDESIARLDQRLAGGERLQLPQPAVDIDVVSVPGHTAGHLAFVVRPRATPGEPASPALLFCGDTLFSAGCGRLFEGSAAQMFDSLQVLDALPADTLVCCAHEYTTANLRFAAEVEPGNDDVRRLRHWAEARRASGLPTLPSSLARERRINPFLRTRETAVHAAVTSRGEDARTPAAVFAALRRWKDVYR